MKNDPLVEILKKNFEQKKSKNKSYSLHSFSRDLQLDPSNLSKILGYQKTVGPRLRQRLGQKLGFDKSDLEGWLKPSESPKTTNRDYKSHDLQVFEIVSEWQHYAILEYFKLAKASSKPEVIASRLGLTLAKTIESLRRLLDTGLLIKSGQGYAPAEDSSSSILSTVTSPAHREQQRQILEGAIEALESVPLEKRSQSSVTMAIDASKVEQAKELIKNFRRDLGRYLSKSENLNEVYQLSVSLYPVTNNQNPKGEKQ